LKQSSPAQDDKKNEGMFKSFWTKKSPKKENLEKFPQSNSEPKIEINTLIESNLLSELKKN